MVLTRRRYRFDEWLDSPENTVLGELAEGIPVERMSTSRDHGRVVAELFDWLRRAERAGFGEVALGPVAVVLDASGSRRNVREPDLCFVQERRRQIITDKAIEGVPDLIIEVLSPRNRIDQLPGGDIWRDYERFGVPSYWIIDPKWRTVSQYTHGGDRYGTPVVLRPGGTLASVLCPGLTLPVADIFASLRG
jgi:Uma2 family endonuclease